MKTLLMMLVFSGVALAQHQVTLTWAWAQGTNDPATGFNVKRATTAGVCQAVPQPAGCVTIASIAGTATTTYADLASASNPLTPGNTYYYAVTATNAGGESAPSNEASAKIPTSPPTAPITLDATAK